MLTILTIHQIGALGVLFTFSMLIAFCPLLILRWFYKRKKRRLKRLNNGMKNSFSSSSSTISDLAIAYTLHIPEIIVNLIRSLNGGLLLATLFLIFIPQLRSNFDTLMNSYVYKSQYHHHGSNLNSLMHMPEPEPFIMNRRNDSQMDDVVFDDELSMNDNNNNTETKHKETKFANVNNEKINSHINNILVLKFSPIPIVEVILCLAFFSLYFVEEFTQLCFHYRKYFWALNSTIVLSSSDGNCNYTSLDYRINCTKRFLIDCSRKTFTTSNCSSSSTTVGVEGEGYDRLTPNPMMMMMNNNNSSNNYHHMDKMIMVPGFESTMTKINPLVQNESFADEQNADDMNVQSIKQQNHQYDSLKLSPNNGDDDDNNDPVDDQNFVNHNEPQSLLSNSSAHLPSYYWQQQQQQPEFDMIANNCPHHDHQPSTIDENLNIFSDKEKHNNHHHCQNRCGCSCCCNCCTQHYHNPNVIQSMNVDQKFDSSSTSTSGLINGQTLEKIFLPNTTQSTNMPALFIGEGILIAIQPSIPLLWLMLGVILMHKMANGLAMANELHYRTTGRQRNLPSSTILMFTSLPSLGCLSVIVANILIYWKINLDFATVSIRMNQQQEQHQSSNHTSLPSLPLEFVILKVVLVSLSAATLLHLIMLTIQQRHYNYWSSTMNPNRHPMGRSSSSSSMKIDDQQQKKSSSSINDGKENRQQKFIRKQPTTTTTKSNPSYLTNSHNSRIFQNSIPIIGKTSILTTLSSKERQKFSSMTISSTDSKHGISNNMPVSIEIDQNSTKTIADYEIGTNDDNIPVMTNVHRNNVLHYFIMYFGFIIILMAIAFLNFKNFKF